MKDKQKVISYRVREYSETEYWVEKYTVRLEAESKFLKCVYFDQCLSIPHGSAEKPPTVQCRTSIWDKTDFRYFIESNCEEHSYRRPASYQIERFNFFLATHYFRSDNKDAWREEGMEPGLLNELNQHAYQYMQNHNKEVYGLLVGFSDAIPADEAFVYRMNRFLLDVGYIDVSEFESDREGSLYITMFLQDNGYLGSNFDDDYADIYRRNEVSTIVQRAREFVKDANRVAAETESRSYKAWKQAKLLFDNNPIDTIECLNVGQANCSLGFGRQDLKNPLVIFDLGVRPHTKNLKFVTDKLKKANASGIVVISHYDSDHIDGYVHLNNQALDRIWILPSKRLNTTLTERNFLSCLNPEHCVFLPNIDYSKEPFQPSIHVLYIGNIEIYRGNCKVENGRIRTTDADQSTPENSRCLICLVKNKESILLPGDSLYREFPTHFSVDYMVVPHHSCHYTQKIINLNRDRLKQLIVCAGPDKGYQHPNMSHIDKLKPGACEVIYLLKENYAFVGKNKIKPTTISVKTSPRSKQSHIINL